MANLAPLEVARYNTFIRLSFDSGNKWSGAVGSTLNFEVARRLFNKLVVDFEIRFAFNGAGMV